MPKNPLIERVNNISEDKTLNTLLSFVIGQMLPSMKEDDATKLVKLLEENIMTEDRIIREYNSGRHTGLQNAADGAKEKLLEMAADAFKSGKNDEEARDLRALAKKIEEHIKSMIPKPT